MRCDRYVVQANHAGNFEVGYYSELDGRWVMDSVHETEAAAHRVMEAMNRVVAAPPTPGPAPLAPLVRLETGDWIDPAAVVGMSVEANYNAIRLRLTNGRFIRLSLWADGDDAATRKRKCRDRPAIADAIAAQINAARLGGGEDAR